MLEPKPLGAVEAVGLLRLASDTRVEMGFKLQSLAPLIGLVAVAVGQSGILELLAMAEKVAVVAVALLEPAKLLVLATLTA